MSARSRVFAWLFVGIVGAGVGCGDETGQGPGGYQGAADASGSTDSDAQGGIRDGGGDGGDSPVTVEIDPCAETTSAWGEDALRVTPADAPRLAELLAQHPRLRLAPGDYRTTGPAQIRLSSNQSIVAVPAVATRFPDVVVAAGTRHARLRGLHTSSLAFEPGAPIRHNCFAHLQSTVVTIHDAQVEQNQFFALGEARLDVDTSQQGYFRDNRVTKLNSHGDGVPISVVGDAARTSGGNTFLMVDAQTPPGSVYRFDSQRDVTFFNVNAEAYNWLNTTETPKFLEVTRTGVFRGGQFSGNERDGVQKTHPSIHIDAEVAFLHHAISIANGPDLRLGPSNRALFSWQNGWIPAEVDDLAPQGLRVFAQEGIADDVAVRIGATELVAPPDAVQSATIRELLATPARPGVQWERPVLPAIPDPTGPTWNADLSSHADDTDALQQLIDTAGIAELEPRIYYVSRPLVLRHGQGLIGAPNGETGIVALTPTIDMIHVEFGNPSSCEATNGMFVLANLTLQGATNGIHSNYPGTQVNHAEISHVTFRNMSGAGILLDRTYGWDNNVFDYVNFVDCEYGFKQDGQPRPNDTCYGIGEWSEMAYVDKTVFWRSQFLRCGHAVSMVSRRPSTNDAFIESTFTDGGPAVTLGQGAGNIAVIGGTFTNNEGNPVVTGPAILLNCAFRADRGQSMVGPGSDLAPGAYVEGATFHRGSSTTATVFGNVQPTDWRHPHWFSMAHSVSELPLGAVTTSLPVAGLLYDNVVADDEWPNAFLVSVEYRTRTTVDQSDDVRDVRTLVEGPTRPQSQLTFGVRWTE